MESTSIVPESQIGLLQPSGIELSRHCCEPCADILAEHLLMNTRIILVPHQDPPYISAAKAQGGPKASHPCDGAPRRHVWLL